MIYFYSHSLLLLLLTTYCLEYYQLLAALPMRQRLLAEHKKVALYIYVWLYICEKLEEEY